MPTYIILYKEGLVGKSDVLFFAHFFLFVYTFNVDMYVYVCVILYILERSINHIHKASFKKKR